METPYVQTFGSFFRNGKYPLEANYIFESEESLKQWEQDNKKYLHEGLFKVVVTDDKQILYWYCNETFKPLLESDSLENLAMILKDFELHGQLRDILRDFKNSYESKLKSIQQELDLTQSGAGLNGDGSFDTLNMKNTTYLEGSNSIIEALKALDRELSNVVADAFIKDAYYDSGRESIIITFFTKQEKEKTIEKKYKIKCNDKTQDRVYYETNTHCVVIYGALDGDINEIYKNATDEQKRAKKKEFVDRIENLGLIMDANNEVHVASNAIMEGRTLSVLNWSPSNMRNETQLMTPIKPDEAFKILDEVSGGALSQALQGELSIEALIKASARLGILGAPAIPMVNSANAEFGYVIYMKEIQGPADFSKEENDKLVNAGIKIDTNTYDGAVAISVEMIKATFARYGMKLSTENALSFAVQTRATKFFTKVFFRIFLDIMGEIHELIKLFDREVQRVH